MSIEDLQEIMKDTANMIVNADIKYNETTRVIGIKRSVINWINTDMIPEIIDIKKNAPIIDMLNQSNVTMVPHMMKRNTSTKMRVFG